MHAIRALSACLLMVCISVARCRVRHSGANHRRPEFTIAVLLPVDNDFRFSQSKVLPAINLAVETLKNESEIAHGFELAVKYRDSQCDIAYSTNEAFNFYLHKDVDIFFGPCCDYPAAPVARQTNYWEIPMLTAGAMAGDFGINKQNEYRLMTRVGTNFNSLARFITATFNYLNWGKFKLIYDAFAQSDIVPRYCHLAADGLHQYIRLQTNISHDYFKFQSWQEVADALPTELGKDYSGRRV